MQTIFHFANILIRINMDYKQQITADFKKKVEDLIRGKTVKDYNEIVDKLGWEKTSMSNVINGRRNVPVEVYENFKLVFNLKTNTVPKEPEPITMQVLAELVASNRDLVSSNKILVETNKSLADDQKELIQMAKQAFKVSLEKLLTIPLMQEGSSKKEDHPVTEDFSMDKKVRSLKGKSRNHV